MAGVLDLSPLKLIVTLLVLSAAGTGLRAAHLWWRASNVPMLRRPDWSGDPEMNRMTGEADALTAWSETGRLNAKAARWTALAVGLSAAAGIVGVF